jgi:hypothetical protein
MASDECVYWFGIPWKETAECRERRLRQRRNSDAWYKKDTDAVMARNQRKLYETAITGETASQRNSGVAVDVLNAGAPLLGAIGAGITAAAGGVPSMGMLPMLGSTTGAVPVLAGAEQYLIPAALFLAAAVTVYAVSK